MMPATFLFIIYLLFLIYDLVCAAAACVRHPAAHAIIVYLLIDLSFSVCSSSMHEASCGSMLPLLLFVIYHLWHFASVLRVAVCGSLLGSERQ
jgi:hypothetical protein